MNSEKEFLVGESLARPARKSWVIYLAVAVVFALVLCVVIAKGVEQPLHQAKVSYFEQGDSECVAENGDCTSGQCCNDRPCTSLPNPCIDPGCGPKVKHVCQGDIPPPPDNKEEGGWDRDNFLADKSLFRGHKICASPGGWDDNTCSKSPGGCHPDPEHGQQRKCEACGGFFCAEVSDDGGFRVKSCLGKGGDPIMTYLDSFQLADAKGAWISLKYGYLGLYNEQWDELWTIGKDESKSSGKKAQKVQMRRDGNLMLLTEDVDANNLDKDDDKILWQLVKDPDRQQPDCGGDGKDSVPCADVGDCENLCYPMKNGYKYCKDWTCSYFNPS